jgi:hypothetical protein
LTRTRQFKIGGRRFLRLFYETVQQHHPAIGDAKQDPRDTPIR